MSYVEDRKRVIAKVALALTRRWWKTRGSIPEYLDTPAELERFAGMFETEATIAVDAVREADAEIERGKLDAGPIG